MKKIMLFLIVVILFFSGCSSESNFNANNSGYLTNMDESFSICSCSGNIYNCDDFKSHSEAQECYLKCGGLSNDVHKLDRDKDGLACEPYNKN